MRTRGPSCWPHSRSRRSLPPVAALLRRRPRHSAASSGGGSGSGLSVGSFDSAFAAMAQLTSVTSAGTGLVGVILPDTTTSARYTTTTCRTSPRPSRPPATRPPTSRSTTPPGRRRPSSRIAQADITAGAKVLLVDPIDSTTGKQIQARPPPPA